MPSDQVFWFRVGAVASVVWVALVVIASQLMRDFSWSPRFSSDAAIGAAGITALAGLVIIGAVCAGIPWIVQRR